jgi:hypothetical protein
MRRTTIQPVPVFFVIAILIIGAGLAARAAEGYIDYVTALPPLFTGLEPDSNLTLQRLLESRTRSAAAENDKANRSIKRDYIAARNPYTNAGEEGEWTLARLNRFYAASQKIRALADVYSPAREYTLLLESDERYSAEWWATLRLINSGRYPFGELSKIAKNTNTVQAALAGRLGRAGRPAPAEAFGRAGRPAPATPP